MRRPAPCVGVCRAGAKSHDLATGAGPEEHDALHGGGGAVGEEGVVQQ